MAKWTEELIINLGEVLFIAYANEAVIEHLLGWPMEKLCPSVDRGWLRYAALASGGAMSWYSGVTLFAGWMPLIEGRILTAVLVGAGSQVIHELLKGTEKPDVAEALSVLKPV